MIQSKSKSTEDKVFDLFSNGYLVLTLLLTLIPLLYVLSTSLTPFGKSPSLFLSPTDWSLEAYKTLLTKDALWKAGLNSLIITGGGVLISVVLTVLCAYPLSRKDLPGRNIILSVILFTFLFNAGMIPTFLTVKELHLLDTHWSIVLPGAISVYNMLVMKTFFQGLPESLEEAAKVDGANDWQVLWTIILPLSKPILLTIGLFYGVYYWNNFFDPILYIQNRELHPLPVALRDILIGLNSAEYVEGSASQNAPEQAIKMAAVVLITLPMLLVYPWIQKHFTKGVLVGGVKE